MATLRDLAALTKPHITIASAGSACAGLALAPGPLSLWRSLAALAGTALVVAGAGALNMVLERDLDNRMPRTRQRPLPAGRMSLSGATALGLLLSLASLALLVTAVNLLTAALAAAGLVLYLLLYTPLKRRTPVALLVGALAGALPPLMGWTAATGELTAPGLVLFGTFVLWQVPHFLAISLFRRQEYAGAGFRTASQVFSPRIIWAQMVVSSTLLLGASLVLPALAPVKWIYLAAASIAGIGLLALALRGLLSAPEPDANRGARIYFRATLLYPPALTLGLVFDALIF